MADLDISPSGVRLIREVRGESRKEFAEEIGVTRKTIGNWERGDSTPRGGYGDAIREAIPSELSLEDVQNAEDRFADIDEPRAHGKEKRLFGSKWLQAVRDEPRISDEFGEIGQFSDLSPKQRMFVERLELSTVSGKSFRSEGSVTTVYYLTGDERRAIRRFIEENESIVRNQLQRKPNRFTHNWDEWIYALLEEEFRFMLYE